MHRATRDTIVVTKRFCFILFQECRREIPCTLRSILYLLIWSRSQCYSATMASRMIDTNEWLQRVAWSNCEKNKKIAKFSARWMVEWSASWVPIAFTCLRLNIHTHFVHRHERRCLHMPDDSATFMLLVIVSTRRMVWKRSIADFRIYDRRWQRRRTAIYNQL